MATMKTLNFGIEIELTNISITAAAIALSVVFDTEIQDVGGYYNKQIVRMSDGRVWTAMFDGSIPGMGAEVVSPILGYEDIETVQEVVRALRRAGGKVNSRCGIHIHVDGAPFKNDPKAIVRLAKVINKDEELLFGMVGTSNFRRNLSGCGCRDLDRKFFDAVKNYKGSSLTQIQKRWYESQGYEASASRQHYNNTRYAALNLHSLWYRGTVEFRWFETTTHAGKVKAYIQLTLALAAKALNAKRSPTHRRTLDPVNAKYDAMNLLVCGLGLQGDEFKTCRTHLLRNLPGVCRSHRVAA